MLEFRMDYENLSQKTRVGLLPVEMLFGQPAGNGWLKWSGRNEVVESGYMLVPGY